MDNLSSTEKNNFLSSNEQNFFLTNSFKVWVLGFLFFLVFIRLFAVLAFPASDFLSEKLLLGLVLPLVAYLWVQELREKYRLQELNESLIEAQRKLQDAQVATISSLILFVEAKDVFVHGHSERVARFSLAIADSLEFSRDTREVIRRSAMLHDLGKVAIPDRILLKPDRLTADEYRIVQDHPRLAVNILEPLKFLHLEKKIILNHHERIDGKGYPAGIKGELIPLESRIIAVADTFDAMNSTRLFREPCTQEYILSELKNSAGTQLDATLVDRFLKALEKNPQYWDRPA